MKYKKQFIILLLIAILGLAYYAARPRLVTVSYNIESTKINTPIKLAVIADLHASLYGEDQEDLVQIITEQNPDAILWVGDIIEEETPIDNSVTLIKLLASYDNYFVSGNHDIGSSDFDELIDIMLSYEFTILSGDTVYLEIGTEKIQICGIDDPLQDGIYTTLAQLETCGETIDSAQYSVLMSHRPEYINHYKEYDFDLTVSGHAHGGQWIVPGLINGVFAPGQGYFPEYAGGHYIVDDMDFIVSRGLALKSPNIPRFFNPCEIVFLNIRPV